MNLIKIKNRDGNTVEVNLDNLGVIEEQQYSNEVILCFGGYFVTIDQDECKRIREMLDQNNINVLCEVGKTEDPIAKFKEIIYKATYLDSNAKLQLIINLESIE